jgi:hypothetical protein
MAENIKVPMKIICGGKGILWKKWKTYFKNKRKNQYFSIINWADHCFYEEGAQEKLFSETLQFLKKLDI